MIQPTVGRIVYYHPPFVPDSKANEVTHAAIIVQVHSDEYITLAVFNEAGSSYPALSVQLYQGEGVRPTGAYAEWMPYQIGQAAKTQQLQDAISKTPVPEDHAPPIGIGTPTQPPIYNV